MVDTGVGEALEGLAADTVAVVVVVEAMAAMAVVLEVDMGAKEVSAEEVAEGVVVEDTVDVVEVEAAEEEVVEVMPEIEVSQAPLFPPAHQD